MARRGLKGPARHYRHSPKRYEDVRFSKNPLHHTSIEKATRLGCRDAVKGRKNPYKAEATGHISAYREGYRICEAIHHTGRPLTRDEQHVANKLSLESEIQFTPLGGRRGRR
jgi:hypothetical protein